VLFRSQQINSNQEVGYSLQTLLDDISKVETDKIRVNIQSPGGDAFEGLAIMNMLRNHPARIEARISGLAASAASFIFLAADHVTVEPAGHIHIHHPYTASGGNAHDLRKTADFLDKLGHSIADLYADKSGHGTQADWLQYMDQERTFTGEEAVAIGLADEFLTLKKSEPAAVNNKTGLTFAAKGDVAAFEKELENLKLAVTTTPQAHKPVDSLSDLRSFWLSLYS
jgi:ATP-dependent protease ClpP protease subunit